MRKKNTYFLDRFKKTKHHGRIKQAQQPFSFIVYQKMCERIDELIQAEHILFALLSA